MDGGVEILKNEMGRSKLSKNTTLLPTLLAQIRCVILCIRKRDVCVCACVASDACVCVCVCVVSDVCVMYAHSKIIEKFDQNEFIKNAHLEKNETRSVPRAELTKVLMQIFTYFHNFYNLISTNLRKSNLRTTPV